MRKRFFTMDAEKLWSKVFDLLPWTSKFAVYGITHRYRLKGLSINSIQMKRCLLSTTREINMSLTKDEIPSNPNFRRKFDVLQSKKFTKVNISAIEVVKILNAYGIEHHEAYFLHHVSQSNYDAAHSVISRMRAYKKFTNEEKSSIENYITKFWELGGTEKKDKELQAKLLMIIKK